MNSYTGVISKPDILYYIPYQKQAIIVNELTNRLEKVGFSISYTNSSVSRPEIVFSNAKYGIVTIFVGTYTDTWVTSVGRSSTILVRFNDPINVEVMNSVSRFLLSTSFRYLANRFISYTNLEEKSYVYDKIKQQYPMTVPIDRYSILEDFGLIAVRTGETVYPSPHARIDIIDLITGNSMDEKSGTLFIRISEGLYSGEERSQLIVDLLAFKMTN